ncbi:hypothetical protein Vadar_013376 [Vaccinium darrowii]|uniref:Uncharacterized protein n=1 Tax=Vaccinium darrowii TaxID=229202 RepID=A0ACB7Z3T5_9ERIC|nr:hypothetical protein Vadar_013376 [Vaccinium darrowii]
MELVKSTSQKGSEPGYMCISSTSKSEECLGKLAIPGRFHFDSIVLRTKRLQFMDGQELLVNSHIVKT